MPQAIRLDWNECKNKKFQVKLRPDAHCSTSYYSLFSQWVAANNHLHQAFFVDLHTLTKFSWNHGKLISIEIRSFIPITRLRDIRCIFCLSFMLSCKIVHLPVYIFFLYYNNQIMELSEWMNLAWDVLLSSKHMYIVNLISYNYLISLTN